MPDGRELDKWNNASRKGRKIEMNSSACLPIFKIVLAPLGFLIYACIATIIAIVNSC